MKVKQWLLALVMGAVLPALIFTVIEKFLPDRQLDQTTEPTTQEQEINQTKQTVSVLHSDGNLEKMDMDLYITGVLLGELPADFEDATLRAQAVVARTYALKRNKGDKHAENAVCTDSACCQAYVSVTDYLTRGGLQSTVDRMLAAVKDTCNQVLTYNGELIEATYFSCSGGRTEDALAVWGTDIPYLQAVDSPGEEKAVHYTDTVRLTASEFADRLGIHPAGGADTWFGATTYTDGGGVQTISVAGVLFKGTELRQKLGLRSTAFTVTVVGDAIYISTKGFGHRVGMSQYGADAMAAQGSTYDEILAHYYPGTVLTDSLH